MRLDKFLAHAGLGTRREVNAILRRGRVQVNGAIERDGARNVADTEQVACDGQPVQIPGPVVIAFYKPAGLVTSTRDPQATIYSILPFDPNKIKPVGRLDKETEGLLLLTDDGELNHRLTSPRRHVEKEYIAKLDREILNEMLQKLRAPLTLENGEKARAAILAEKIGPKTLRLVIDEGKYHQVRRMCAAVGGRVLSLSRIRVGLIRLEGLKSGEHRPLTIDERANLWKLTKIIERR